MVIQTQISKGILMVTKIESEENLADPFTKVLPVRFFEKHVDYMGVKNLPDLF